MWRLKQMWLIFKLGTCYFIFIMFKYHRHKFAKQNIFVACTCGDDDCEECSEFQFRFTYEECD